MVDLICTLLTLQVSSRPTLYLAVALLFVVVFCSLFDCLFVLDPICSQASLNLFPSPDNEHEPLISRSRHEKKLLTSRPTQDTGLHCSNWLTYSESNHTSGQRKEPESVRESCHQTYDRNDEPRYVHGDFPAKLVAERTNNNPAEEEPNENHRWSNSTVQSTLTHQIKLSRT